jgi:thioredoxin 2
MSDALHVVCPHCHTTNRVREGDLAKAPDCGSCHKALFTAHSTSLSLLARVTASAVFPHWRCS